jgi:ribosome-associated protein
MVVGLPQNLSSSASDEYIKLDQFLKLAQVVQSGGEAKHRIRSGLVLVNGEIETRRGRKLRRGDVVTVDGEELVVEIDEGDSITSG